MSAIVAYINKTGESRVMFSVCSLVRSQSKFERLVESFARLGFTRENSEFLAADNRTENQFDGYSWYKTLIAEARGQYVIFCHDDIELIEDGYEALMAQIRSLDERDPKWLLAGVAGGIWHPRDRGPSLALRISDKFGEDRKKGTLPSRVETLDECFIVMRRHRPVVGSYDLSGFHYYGPDLCLQAELAGGSAYAIDFHLRHHGNVKMGRDFYAAREAFVRKYGQYFPDRSIRCMTGRLILTAEST